MKKLAPSAEMTLGPFFPREFAQGANDLTHLDGRPAEGEVIEITGRVTQLDGKPLDNLVLEIWQPDAHGRFDNPDFLGWGRAATDSNGIYSFRTIRPGGRVPSINMLLLYSGLMRQLQTVLYFQPGDHSAKLVAKKEGPSRYRFDIRLRGEDETPFFDD